MNEYATIVEAKDISKKLFSDLKEGRLSKVGIDEIRVRCLGYNNYDWLVNKVLRLMIMGVG